MKRTYFYLCLMAFPLLTSSCRKVSQIATKDAGKKAIAVVETSVSKLTPNLEKALGILPKALQDELAEVLIRNPKLAKFLDSNPQFITKWVQFHKQIPSASEDVTFMKLFLHIDEYEKYNATKLTDFIFKEGKNGDIIIIGKEGEVLGKIKKVGPIILIPKGNLNNIFVQLKPLPNCKYVLDDAEYVTDDFGRVIESKFEVSKEALAKHHYWTENSSVLNSCKAAKGAKESDQAGHLLADEFGGSTNMLNIVPMTEGVNKSAFRKIEQEWKKLAEQGKNVKVSIKLKYSGNLSRPSWIIVTYIIDGKTIVKEIPNI